MTGWRLTSSMPAMMRCLSSCFDVTRIWRRTERANLAQLSQLAGKSEQYQRVHRGSRHYRGWGGRERSLLAR